MSLPREAMEDPEGVPPARTEAHHAAAGDQEDAQDEEQREEHGPPRRQVRDREARVEGTPTAGSRPDLGQVVQRPGAEHPKDGIAPGDPVPRFHPYRSLGPKTGA